MEIDGDAFYIYCILNQPNIAIKELYKKGAVAHVTAPLLFVESKNKKHVFVKIKACATDFLENQKFSMDL